jgi:hypothetical protein
VGAGIVWTKEQPELSILVSPSDTNSMPEPISVGPRIEHTKSSNPGASARVRSFGTVNSARMDAQSCCEIMQLLYCDPLCRIVQRHMVSPRVTGVGATSGVKG